MLKYALLITKEKKKKTGGGRGVKRDIDHEGG